MFEDSLVESGGKLKTKSKYWMILTFSLNAIFVAVLILIPLIYPEALPKNSMSALLVAPPPPPPPPPTKVVPEKIVSELDQGLHAPTKIPKDIKMIKEEAPPPPSAGGVAGMGGMSGTGAIGGIMGAIGNGPAPAVKMAKPAGPQRVSGGVMTGMLISEQRPLYPPIAKAAHVSGTVVLAATISKQGTITNLRVVSGPAMLQQSALDAVRNWRYKPYLLNGEPVEVETTVNVVFNFGG